MSIYQNMLAIVNQKLISDNKIFVAPNIPEKKFVNALESYGYVSISKYNFVAKHNNTLLLIDDTLLGGSKEGCMLNIFGVYTKAFMQDPKFVPYKNISNVHVIKKKLLINGNEILEFGFQSEKAIQIICEIIKDLTKYAIEHEDEYKKIAQSNININKKEKKEDEKLLIDYLATVKEMLALETVKYKEEMCTKLEESEIVHKPKAILFGTNQGIKAGILASAYFIIKEIETYLQKTDDEIDEMYLRNLFEAFEMLINERVELNNSYRHICNLPDEEVVAPAEFVI